MSLITRCPACETLFKVVPDQLRISEGWVRCGQCDEIFDASLHLLEAASEELGPASQPADGVAPCDAMIASDAMSQSVGIDLDSVGSGSPNDVPIERAQILPDATDEEVGPVSDGFSRADEVSAWPMAGLDAQAEGSQPASLTTVLPASISSNDEPVGLSDVSFLRDKKAGAFWRKPLMRATLVLLCLTLLLGLTGQIVVHERDRILALKPGLKPWLLAICGPLNCTVSPLKRIESIVIDSSSFAKTRGDIYRLNFTLKNTAATALAVPAIELTLTDSLDQPVVRRIFLAPELGAQSDTLAAGVEWPASLAVAVKAGGMADRIAGYRLLAFYP